MNNPDHISECLLRYNFWVKLLKFFDADIRDLGWKKFGSGMEKVRIRIRNTAVL